MDSAFDILYVTSFTPDLYAETGRVLVRSFLESRTEGKMLLCHEGAFGECLPVDAARLVHHDLDASPFLVEWLAANRDIIPAALGGTAVSCSCEDPASPVDHRDGCVFHWYNKNASRWFRKIVALEIASRLAGNGAIVWIDCDCQFVRRLPAAAVADLFGSASVLYHKGPDRTAVESGVMAVRLDPPGRSFLRAVIERFRSGDFRRDLRWDDGYQFSKVIESQPELPCKDLGGRSHAPRGVGHVLPGSPLGYYLRHRKGVHARLKLMV
jgi:hypothetical protein